MGTSFQPAHAGQANSDVTYSCSRPRRGCPANRASASRRARCANTPLTPASLRAPSPRCRPIADAQRSRDRTARRNPAATCGLRYAPSAPVRAGRYTSPSVRRHYRPATTIRAHISAASAPRHHDKSKPVPLPGRIAPPRTARASTPSTASDLRCENFLYCY